MINNLTATGRLPGRVSPNTLARLLFHGEEPARFSAARHMKTPATSLAVALQRDSYGGVRWAAANHPFTPPQALALALETDRDPDIRREAARHPRTPISALERALQSERDESVREALRRRLNSIVSPSRERSRRSLGASLAS